MKCEDFVLNHETGSALTRLRARLHAQHCPKCAQAQQRLAELRKTLAVPADLTPYHRRVWERAAAEAAVEPAGAWSWLTGPRLAVAGGLAVAAAVIVAIVLTVADSNSSKNQRIANIPQRSTHNATRSIRPASAEWAQLEIGLGQVERDLERLAKEAELLEARSAISELAALYQPLRTGDST